MIRTLVLMTAMVGTMSAQPSATGRTSTVRSFDPLQLAGPVGMPFEGKPERSVISKDEYERRRSQWARRPQPLGPPGVETVDLLAIGRSPSPILRQPLSLTPATSFEGISNTGNTSPADTDLAAGPEDLVLVVNTTVARYSKSGEQTNSMTLAQWFANLLPTVCPAGAEQCRIFEPSVRYDSLHGRFLLLAYSQNRANNRTHFLLSVSNGATYASGWRNWALEANLNGTVTTSFEVATPQLGYDNTAVYLTGNMFSSQTFVYAKIRVLKKSELYNPATTSLTFRDFWDMRNADSSQATSIRPAILRGRAGSVNYGTLISAPISPNADYLTVWRVDNATADNPTLTRVTVGGLWPFDIPAPITQAHSQVTMDAGDTRVQKAIVRDGILFTARNTGYAADPTTVTYDRLDLARERFTLQSRLFGGTFFYPAYDIPASLGPGNALPNKLISGTTTNPAGNLTFAGISDVKAGEDRYELVTENRVRWGEYFGSAIDPVNGGLWVYGQYAKPRGNTAGVWGTWASYFPWKTSPQFADVDSSNTLFDYINTMRVWSITTGCNATNYCPGANVTRGQMAVFVIRGLLGDSFQFPSQPYFTDVPATHPFFNFIQKMRELGITSGCTATTYCADANVTRGEMAAFLIRGKLRALLGDTFVFPSAAYFTDVPSTHPFFNFVQKMRELGVTSGCTATTYCPEAAVTREQMAAFVVRAFLN
ncbi:MAG: S-layer homology domain-containing protein [Bryobacterales bacterium]|nr:S-layer homology domain-containing protein [Bryobacterales bacterium]